MQRVEGYFDRILRLEAGKRIHRAVWQRFRQPIQDFVANRYVYWLFWNFQRNIKNAETWIDRLEEDVRNVNNRMKRQNTRETASILRILFSRLYILRNQLLHGGATWQSSVNREQVRQGARIMYFLVPIFTT